MLLVSDIIMWFPESFDPRKLYVRWGSLHDMVKAKIIDISDVLSVTSMSFQMSTYVFKTVSGKVL